VALFKSDIITNLSDIHQYAVTPDGQRFLINVTTREAATAPITLLVNWARALDR
jgi:hypothetical protein